MTPFRIAIVGAGIAGLACARDLLEAGLAPVIFDKGRGIGGRLATRRAEDGLQFDHGAPCVMATDAGFAEVLRQAEVDGAAAPCPTETGGFVGLPGMSGLARHLGRGVEIRTGVAVGAVTGDGDGWRVICGDRSQVFDRVILTLPAPQILRLLGTDHSLTADVGADLDAILDVVRIDPCLTLMAAFAGYSDAGPCPPDLRQITLDSAKPGRDRRLQAWVAHATPEFSRRHLEREMTEVAGLMLPMLCASIGRAPAEAVHAVAHRWRYAQVDRALGRPFVTGPSGGLYLGGDWCLGPMAEHAWTSGRAIAADILRN
ncbi:MAG: FAD-dependent oxidoreductase [Tabrizicola sp.]|uniref:NAD(P)/FAD-dependent oxidoreductase n=1 Tax=Tabrizicola sp. TaxID=2005166 RepID=UPI002732940B|nr:FAD-dependent oxidoreductase [Tabrizicola sp.]MDP3263451.1 FAD-dependent oxidoreductase [Tabrizicola sp.]MDP3646808.1 FAD-dependent oxidoreductase [Paracoccaceae bacterium]